MFLVCNSTVNKRINCGFVHQFCRLFCDVAPWKLVEKVRCNLGANSIKHCRFRLSKGVQGAAKKYPYCKKTLRRYFLSHQVVLAQFLGLCTFSWPLTPVPWCWIASSIDAATCLHRSVANRLIGHPALSVTPKDKRRRIPRIAAAFSAACVGSLDAVKAIERGPGQSPSRKKSKFDAVFNYLENQ